MKHLSEKQIVALAMGFGEAAHATHAEGCERCRAGLQAYAATLAVTDALQAPASGDLWSSLAPRLEAAVPARRRRHVWIWIPAAAALACAVALWLGLPRARTLPPAPAPAVATSVPVAQPGASPLLRLAVAEHLDRTQVLLIELAHAGQGAPRTVDLTREKAVARQLATSNQLYLQSADYSGDRAMAHILGALQPPLLEIAHAPGQVSAPHWRRLQHSIATSGVLFKIRVLNPDPSLHGAL